jgi:hypothetical protein
MRTAIAAAVLMLLSVPAGARQDQPQFVISVRLFAADPAAPGSADVLAQPQLRTFENHEASMRLGDSANLNGLRLAVTPSDAGSGRVALKVSVELLQNGRSATSRFDVLGGAGTTPATIALRDASGAFVVDEQGRPVFALIEAAKK